MAGKTNLTATLFSQKKLLGRAHTSNLKSDAQESIPSNIQVSSQTIFGETIPENPSLTLYALQSASAGASATVEYVNFKVEAISGTSYDANTGSFGNVGFGGGDEATSAGTHGYKLVMTGNYESLSSNSKAGNGYFDDDKTVYETLGKVQLIPPSFSNEGANPYYLKLYKGDPTDATNEITSLDETDWQIDYYSGIVFLQDYQASRIPTHARGFLYVGKMVAETTGSGGGSLTFNNGADNRILTGVNSSTLQGEANLTFDGSTLNISSTTGGVVIPRMTTTQRNSISNANGTMIYNTTDNVFQFYQNGSWSALGSGGGTSTVITTGNGILVLSDDGAGGNHRALLTLYNVSASSYSSKIIYLANTASSPVGPFTIPRKFYFNENGVWFPSSFSSLNTSVANTASVSKPDLHDILHLNGNNQEDRAILTNFNANSASYSGRAIYISNTGSSGSIGPFVRANKHYFNENGVWFPSVFGGL
jgi:hypothetical protein